ncbi:MAG: ATP-binding protein [Oscillospiraceae bacterium]
MKISYLVNIISTYIASVLALCTIGNAVNSLTTRNKVICAFVGIINAVILIFAFDSIIPLPIIYFAMFLLYFSEGLIIFNASSHIILCYSLAIAFYAASMRGIVTSIFCIITNNNIYTAMRVDDIRIFCQTINAILISIVIILFHYLLPKPRFACLVRSRSQLHMVTAVESVMLIYLLMMSFSYYFYVDFVWFAQFVLVSVLALQAGHGLLVERALRVSKWLEENLKQEILSTQLNRQLTHYKAYQKHVESFREFSKEYHQSTGALRHKIQTHDIDGALALLEDTDIHINQLATCHREYSSCMLVDAILEDYNDNCVQNNIEFEAKIFIPDKIPLSDLELCRLFSNIFTNAYESCIKVPASSKRFIHFCSEYSGDWLIICETNTLGEALHYSKQSLVTDKENKEQHGLGVSIIREIIESKGGFIEFGAEENEQFCMKIHLPTPQ